MWKRFIISLVDRNDCLRKTYLLWPIGNLISFNRNYCDIKTNVELLFCNSEMPTIPSVLKIKRVIKNKKNHELNDGFSCIRTKCPACTLPKANGIDAKQQPDIYINKISGEDTTINCFDCRYIFLFHSIFIVEFK